MVFDSIHQQTDRRQLLRKTGLRANLMPGKGKNASVEQSGTFATTHWSVLAEAGNAGSPGAMAALDQLCRTYWFPLYAFVRRSGHDDESAKDLTQAFFEQFLRKNYLEQVDREKGRFRSFLLASLKHFLANQRDRQNTLKRGGAFSFIAWEPELEDQLQEYTPLDLPADQIYERQWALTLLDQVFARVQEECASAGKSELFDTLSAYLTGEESSEPYADAAAKLSMTPGAVQVAVHRLRRRYGELLRLEIRRTLSRPDEIDDEIRHLFSALRSNV